MCKTDFKNLIELSDYFADDKSCRNYLEQWRWNGSPQCPYCKHKKLYRFKDGKNYKCADCRKRFSVTVGTIFENSKISLRKWFISLYLTTSHKKGISSHQLSKDIGVTQKTAWFMLQRIREMLVVKAPQALEGTVQVDESFFGGKAGNRHAHEPLQEKTIVLGLLQQQDGYKKEVRAKVVKSRKAKDLIPQVLKNIKPRTIVVSDDFGVYIRLRGYYQHVSVNHSAGEYARGWFHTNSIENFWSHLKRGLYGIYHHCSPQHLQRYCDEFAFRYNTKDCNEVTRFNIALFNGNGKRLRYKELIEP